MPCKNLYLLYFTCITSWLLGWAPAFSQGKYPPKREFRGVWIATINNIDWPSQAGLTAAQQQDEFIRVLDYHQKTGINAVIVQVRPSADALYPSPYEPWSEWLNGSQGRPPEAYYDPLAFMIAEAHRRGMEFHAWLNPLRAVANLERSNVHPGHISRQKPHWFLRYGNLLMFDPGLPEVRAYIVQVIGDLLERYDIDGIHFDDYFYPYPDPQYVLADNGSFRKYGNGMKYKKDWRRENINQLISAVHQCIAAKKPHVKFGVSPYGVWRDTRMSAYGSPTTSGYTSYDHLHADVRLWLENGWIDYVAPQLYQSTAHRQSPFKPLAKWWSENTFGRHLYIGHAAYRIYWTNDPSWNSGLEMPNQLRYCRELALEGSIFYSSRSLVMNRGYLRDSLQKEFYRYPAFLPTMPWKDATPPNPPKAPAISNAPGGIVISWQQPDPASDQDEVAYFAIYRGKKDTLPDVNDIRNLLTVLPGNTTYFIDAEAITTKDFSYQITAFDRLHNESSPVYPSAVQPEAPSIALPFSQEELRFFSEFALQRIKKFTDIPAIVVETAAGQ